MSNSESQVEGQHSDGCIVTPQAAFGITSKGPNSMCYLESKLVYPVGVNCAIHNTKTNEMGFLPSHEQVRRIVGVAVSKSNKYMACIEEVDESETHQVTVYSIQTLKRVKTLVPDSGTVVESSRVVCIHFSENSKFLLVQHGGPDCTLVIWRWYSGKIVSSLRLEYPVLKAIFSPVDNNMAATVSKTFASLVCMDNETGTLQSVPLTSAVNRKSPAEF